MILLKACDITCIELLKGRGCTLSSGVMELILAQMLELVDVRRGCSELCRYKMMLYTGQYAWGRLAQLFLQTLGCMSCFETPRGRFVLR